jgi:hypothetical protein
MMVRTECKGRKVTGIYIGPQNVRRNFSRQAVAIEFELGHLRIGCKLDEGFWRDQPRICDSRLCEWLEFKLYRERKHMTPLPLMLLQSGRDAFKLRPVSLPAVSLIGIGESKANVPRHHHDEMGSGIGRRPHQLSLHRALP